MPTNPNVKRVVFQSKSIADVNAAFNKDVDEAFDEGIGAYQASQENTLAQIDALYEEASQRIKVAAEKELKKADEEAYQVIIDAYHAAGLKGDDHAGE